MLGTGTPSPPNEAPCAPTPARAVSVAVVSGKRAGGTVHDDGGTATVVATCADDGRQRLLLLRACARATRGCGWGRRSWGARAARARSELADNEATQLWWLQRLQMTLPCRLCAVWRRLNGEAVLIRDG